MTAFALTALWSVASVASLEKGRYSVTEKVGFAFHTLAKFPPDFKSWIVTKEVYQKAYPVDRLNILNNETQRLKNGYINYDPDRDFFTVEVKAQIDASHYYGESQRVSGMTDVTISLPDVPENIFPFQVGDIWVAVVIKDFDKLTKFSFDRDAYKEFATKLRLNRYGNTRRIQADMDFTLRPLSVDTDSPIELQGVEMWLMLAEVAQMQMWRQRGDEKDYLWDYKAPWYITREEEQLLQLYWQD